MDGHDPEVIRRAVNHQGLEAAALSDRVCHVPNERCVLVVERERIHSLAGEHDELREVERVGSFAKDLSLRSALASLAKEIVGVLKVVRGGVTRERLRGLERLTVAREHITNRSLRDRDERHLSHRELQRHEPVQSAAKNPGLKACFSLEREHAPHEGPARTPTLDDAHAIIRDVTNAREQKDKTPSADSTATTASSSEASSETMAQHLPARWLQGSSARWRGKRRSLTRALMLSIRDPRSGELWRNLNADRSTPDHYALPQALNGVRPSADLDSIHARYVSAKCGHHFREPQGLLRRAD